MSEARLQVCGCLWERSVWGATIGSNPTTETETATGNNRLGRETCCGRRQDLGGRSVCRIGDEVGVCVCRGAQTSGAGGGGIIKEKSLGSLALVCLGGVERMGLWGTGGGLERPKRRTRPCMQVEGRVQRSSPLHMR
jgi:hypothetical protein